MRYLARAFREKGNQDEAYAWHMKSIGEAPFLREPYIDFAMTLCEEKDWNGVLFFTEHALQIQEKSNTYINEGWAWGSLPYDLASLGYYFTGAYNLALEKVEQALLFSPDDLRLQRNKQWIEKSIGS